MRPLSLRQWTSSGRGEDVFGYRTYGRNEVALTFIKATHTLAWLSIESCMAYVLYAGAAKRTDRRGALAGAVVTGESLIFTANRRDRTSCSVHLGW